MQIKEKPSGKLPDDWFWKLLAVLGTAASIASLIISLCD